MEEFGKYLDIWNIKVNFFVRVKCHELFYFSAEGLKKIHFIPPMIFSNVLNPTTIICSAQVQARSVGFQKTFKAVQTLSILTTIRFLPEDCKMSNLNSNLSSRERLTRMLKFVVIRWLFYWNFHHLCKWVVAGGNSFNLFLIYLDGKFKTTFPATFKSYENIERWWSTTCALRYW